VEQKKIMGDFFTGININMKKVDNWLDFFYGCAIVGNRVVA